MDDQRPERAAMDGAAFREANERIRAAADEHQVEDNVPFICECADPECTTIIRLSRDEYDKIRSVGSHFLNAVGHHRNGLPVVRVVENLDRYEIVEQLGGTVGVTGELDPRADA